MPPWPVIEHFHIFDHLLSRLLSGPIRKGGRVFIETGGRNLPEYALGRKVEPGTNLRRLATNTREKSGLGGFHSED